MAKDKVNKTKRIYLRLNESEYQLLLNSIGDFSCISDFLRNKLFGKTFSNSTLKIEDINEFLKLSKKWNLTSRQSEALLNHHIQLEELKRLLEFGYADSNTALSPFQILKEINILSFEINKIGNNINQIAKKINQSGRINLDRYLKELDIFNSKFKEAIDLFRDLSKRL